MAMSGEIQKFVYAKEVGLPEGHQLKYRIRENENLAYERVMYYECDNEDYQPSSAARPNPSSPEGWKGDWDTAWSEWERKHQPKRPKLKEEKSIDIDDPWFDDPPFRQESRLGSVAEKACGTILSKFSKVSFV